MKYKIFTFFLCSLFYFSKAQVVSYQLIQSYSIQDLEQIINNFGATGLLVPDYPVDLYRVLYKTEYNDSLTTVSGALVVPQGVECKMPLISYQHGTSSTKTNSPSYGSQELNILLIFASEGKLLVAPDYIGLGASTIDLHPYQHGYSQAHSTINMLRAARELESDLSYDLGNQIYLFGYSQGGHATAAAVMYIEQMYSNEFKVTAAMPMSGAFNLAGAQTDFINNGQPYATPGYLPYIVMGYQSVYHDLYDSIQEIFIPPYDSLMPYYLLGHQYGIGFISGQSDPIPINMFTQQASNSFFNDPNFPFKVRLVENDLTLNGWVPQTPMRMYYCTGDEQVAYQNSLVADSVWNALGAPDVASVRLTNDNHNGCVDKALIAGKLFLEGKLNNGIEVLLSVNGNTITASVFDDDISNYDVEWSDGSSGLSINNVQDGLTYTVTLTHKTNGCSNTKSFTKESALGIADYFNELDIKIFPSPAQNYVTIDVSYEDNYTVQIFNSLGETVHQYENNNNSQAIININNFTPGVYFVVVNGTNAYRTSFIKK